MNPEIKNDKYLKTYTKYSALVEKKLSSLLINKKPASLYEPCSFIIQSGGKRLRPFLVMISADAAGLDYRKSINAAVSVELFHNFTLVHDDIMDNADKRRGLPTLHKKYDLSTAILAGDNLIALAYHYLILDTKINTLAVMNTFTNGVIEVCEGQSLDKEFELRNDVTIPEYITMITKKTAALAETCCKIGGLIGDGSNNVVNALSNYGKNIGIAFQLQDDLLDVIADEKNFGKRIGGDLREGKKTFLYLKALERAKGNDKKELLKLAKNKGVPEKEIKNFINIYYNLDIINETKNEIDRYTRKALKSVDVLNEKKEIFNWLAKTLIKRIK